MGLVRRAGTSLEDGPAGGGTDPAAGDALLDDRAEVRLRAAAELAAQLEHDPSGTAGAAAVPALLAAWEREDVPAVRQALLTALSRADRPEVGRVLAAGLRVEDASARNAVVRALQEMPVAVEAVAEELLVDADRDVRVLAVMVLSALPHPGVPGWLRPVVARDEDAAVVAAAVDVAVTLEAGLAADLSALASARFPHDPYLSFLADLADSADSAAST